MDGDVYVTTKGIPEAKIAELKQAVDIVDVVSEYVQLKKQGRNFVGLCPFHGENTPSFSVSPEKQIFHCFGCGVGGNVFTFLMEIDDLPFRQAVEKIAAKTNVELNLENYSQDYKVKKLTADQAQMIEAHELLAKFYHHVLLNTNEGAEALEYLLKRGFTEKGIQKFQIGYSLPEWDFAVKFLEKRGFPPEVMEQAGLIVKREKEDLYFDRFRNRIMFPLHDDKGNFIAFSARSLATEDQPKYLNTPETVIFNKSTLLYNYHQARSHIRKLGYAVLFEGFADVIAADNAGVPNGVAVMGTSLTEKHIRSLKRLTDSVILCLDSDDAGIKAAYRSGVLLENQAMTVTVALMPQGLDPDDYIRQNGPDKFREDVIGNSLTWMAFKLLFLRRGKNLQNEGEMLDYIEKAMNEIVKLNNAVERDLYIRQLSEEFSLSFDALMQQFQQIDNSTQNQKTKFQQKKIENAIPVAQTPSLPANAVAERRLIGRMLQDEELVYRIMDMLGDTPFHYDDHQAILTYLIRYYEEANSPDSGLFLQYLPDSKLRRIVSEIEMLSINDEYSEKELNDYVSHVLKHPKMLMIKEKQAEQKAAERKKDYAKALELAREIIELRKSL
ncbi:DNA primase [Bacillus niameyensis]|uniref:DNA primase n=1 Tax=Bacillus niameyensis TaxID=1522308 RepID=UPI001E56A2C9|nr:DNA primase [Bacillus niameyensis]